MSEAPYPISIRTAIEGRWQVPLLVISLGLLVAGLFRLRPVAVAPTFGEQVAQIEALTRGGLYVEAASLASQVLDEGAPSDEQRAELHGLLGRIHFLSASRMREPDPVLAREILAHYELSVPPGGVPSAETLEHMAQARAWLGQLREAMALYREALAAGSDDPLLTHRKIYELGERLRPRDEAAQRRHLDEIIELARDSPEYLLWAIRTKAALLLSEGQADAAKALVDGVADQVARGDRADEYEFLRARCRYEIGEYAEAARMLTALRQQIDRNDELEARTGWLLGRTMLEDGRPQSALAQFEEVIRLFPGGPWHALSLIGRAEAQVAMRRYAEAAESYREGLAMPAPRLEDARFDREAIRASLTSQYEVLDRAGESAAALEFLELADTMVPDSDEQRKPFYASRLADLHTRLAAELHKTAEGLGAEKQEALHDLQRRAHDHLVAAGENFSLYSVLTTRQADTSAAALLEAADRFDQAGEAGRAIETLRLFLRRWPGSRLVPEATYRLGQRLQASGRYAEAVEAYEHNLSNYPRMPAAFQSYLPLAEAYLALGEKGRAQAERTLLQVVSPTAAESIFTPDAQEYRDALFKLGELYSQEGRYEDAISRLEEAVQRYSDDPRIVQAKFMLASAHRQSAAGLAADLQDAAQSPYRGQMQVEFSERMERARTLFEAVIEAIRDRPAPLSPEDERYFELAMLYQADCLFDLRRYDEALDVYEEAAWTFHDRPRALSAYVQIVVCRAYLGRPEEARAALARAQQIARKIPAEEFEAVGMGPNKEYWEEFLAWVGESGMF